MSCRVHKETFVERSGTRSDSQTVSKLFHKAVIIYKCIIHSFIHLSGNDSLILIMLSKHSHAIVRGHCFPMQCMPIITIAITDKP